MAQSDNIYLQLIQTGNRVDPMIHKALLKLVPKSIGTISVTFRNDGNCFSFGRLISKQSIRVTHRDNT